MVGVSSSPPGSHSASSSVWRLICSTFERRSLAFVIASATASSTDPSPKLATASGSGTISATLYGRRSPITTTEPISGLVVLIVLSMFAGDMFLPAALMMSSFLRSTIVR